MNKTKKAITVTVIVLAVIAAGILAFWIYEEFIYSKANKEEEEVDTPPAVLSGNYYLDGDKDSSLYWFEIKGKRVILHGDMDKYIADYNIEYLPDSGQSESSDNAPVREDTDDEDLGYETPTYSRLRELLDTKLEYKLMEFENSSGYRVIISPEGSIRSNVRVEFEYISQKEFTKDGKTFRLAE